MQSDLVCYTTDSECLIQKTDFLKHFDSKIDISLYLLYRIVQNFCCMFCHYIWNILPDKNFHGLFITQNL